MRARGARNIRVRRVSANRTFPGLLQRLLLARPGLLAREVYPFCDRCKLFRQHAGQVNGPPDGSTELRGNIVGLVLESWLAPCGFAPTGDSLLGELVRVNRAKTIGHGTVAARFARGWDGGADAGLICHMARLSCSEDSCLPCIGSNGMCVPDAYPGEAPQSLLRSGFEVW